MFEAMNKLLFKEKGNFTSDILHEFTPYMVGRYLSFYDENFVHYTNETINSYGHLFEDKMEQFDFYNNVIPKLRRKKISYIKKPKREEKKEIEIVPEFYSKKEMEWLQSLNM